MRIISGSAKGRIIKSVPGRAVRPTSDRVKESLFNKLSVDFKDKKVLDLFAGSGNLGLEALSRGACSVTFVDNSRQSLKVVKENLVLTGWLDKSQIICADALSAVKRLHKKQENFDVVFADPPYYEQKKYQGKLCNYGTIVLSVLDACDIVLPGSRILVEHHQKIKIELPAVTKYELQDMAVFGDTAVSFFGFK